MEVATTPRVKNPFKFLEAFTEADIATFAGRGDETEYLYEMAHSGDIMLVFGESGVGKTSIVQCGLANRFQKTDWYDVWIRRGDNVNESLKQQLRNCLAKRNRSKPKDENSVVDLIHALFLDYFKPIYLIFDQMEELFVLGKDEEKTDFYQNIKSILKARLSCKIIFILREEYLGKCHDFEKVVPELFARRLKINRMEVTPAQEVVRRAADVGHIELLPNNEAISNRIINACIDDTKKVNLPYLQVLLDTLWRNAYKLNPEKIAFTDQLIDQVGKIQDVLFDFLRDRVSELGAENEDMAWLLLQQFISPDGVTKKPVKLDEINCIPKEKAAEWIRFFEKNRILKYIDTGHYDLAHQTLVPIIKEVKVINVRPRLTDPPIKGNPYKGLNSYEEEDRNRFYGRAKVVADLYQKITKEKIIAIVGPSGAGKSSLVKAGLLPKLKEDGYQIISVRPGSKPDELVTTITDVFHENPGTKKFVLYIDQYEELITQCGEKPRREKFIGFIRTLLDDKSSLLDDGIDIRIILSIRSDFEPQFDSYLSNYWHHGRVLIPSFSREEIRDIIVEPAYQAGLEFQPPTLVDLIVDEVSQSRGSLPLLSYTLDQMYAEYEKSQRGDGYLTMDAYNALGGVIGGLRTRANEIFDKSDAREQRTIRNVMLRMVSFTASELAGRRATESDLTYASEQENKQVKEVLEKFLDKRLIKTGKDDKQQVYFEPAHDSLVRSWEKLWEWINADTQGVLTLQARLAEAVKDYENDGSLWDTNNRLDIVKEIICSNDNWLNKRETEFVNASLAKREEARAIILKREEREKAVLEEKRIRLIIGLVIISALLVLTTYSFFRVRKQERIANQEKQNAQLETEKAKRNANLYLAQKATADSLRTLADSTSWEAMLQAQLAKQSEQKAVRAKELAVQQTKLAVDAETRANLAREEAVKAKSLVLQLYDNEKYLTDSLKRAVAKYEIGKHSSELKKLAETIEGQDPALAYRAAYQAHILNPNDSLITDYYNKLSNRAGYYETMVIPGKSASFSRDGRLMLMVRNGNQVDVWTTDGTKLNVFEESDRVMTTQFSNDGRYVLTVTESSVTLRDLQSHYVFAPDVEKPVRFATLSEDGRQIVVASGNIVKLWDVNGSYVGRMTEPTATGISAAGIDSSTILVQSEKGVTIRDRKNLKVRDVVTVTPKDPLSAVFLIPGAKGIVVYGSKEINIYNAKGTLQHTIINNIPYREYNSISAFTFSNDGTKALISFKIGSLQSQSQTKNVSYESGVTYVLDLKTMQLRPFKNQSIPNASFSADGNRVLITEDGQMVLYDSEGRRMAAFGKNSLFDSWQFHPAGLPIITSSRDGETKLWITGTPASLDAQGKLARFSDDQLRQAGIK